MPIFLKVSNSLNGLAHELAGDCQGQKKEVFLPVYIITQTEGMNTWLKYQLASHLGIAANFRYVKSQELINQVYFLLGGRSSDLLSSENLSWILFKLLGETQFKEKFPEVSNYYSSDAIDRDVKRMALAEKIADLFDQYQIYRPKMIRDWNATSPGNQSGWQGWLWTRSRQLLMERLPDKTNICSFIIEELKKPEQRAKLQARMPVIYLFGLSIITKYHVELYHALAECVDMRLYLINPAPEQYWFEDRNEKQLAILKRKGIAIPEDAVPGNALLTSWGKVLQDTFNLLFEDEEALNLYEEVRVKKSSPATLLQKIQSDIFNNSAEASLLEAADLADGSVTINSCYSPAREVEVLYNFLVRLVDKEKKALSPRDIVVMVSDINAYAPYIKAVFDNAPFKFRYSITDESYVEMDSVSAALRALLLITEDNFTSENVIQILDSSFVRKRFGITEVSLIRTAINQANIRFGIENNWDDESALVSWKYGLKRIMYGICMNGEEEYGEGI